MSVPSKPIFVILHGLANTKWHIRKVEKKLSSLGYETWSITYPSMSYSLEEIADFVGNLLKLKFTEDQIDNAISLSSFDKLEKMEKDNGFTESTIGKDGKRNKFFFLGPKNDWKKILNNNTTSLIEKEFESEMKELKYL